MQPNPPLKTFIIYARKDESFKNDLLQHLQGSLIPTGHLQVWQDGDILPGEDWEQKIKQHLEASDLFLVLLSIHSLTSTFIQQKELVKALEKKSRIVPILVRSCMWNINPVFAGLQGLPKNMKPVTSFADHDDAWTEVMEKLHEMVEAIWAEERTGTDADRKKQPAAAEKHRIEEIERKKWLPEMVFVKGGVFQMGDEHGDLWEGCRPVHAVTLSDFEISKYPVSQKQWTAIMGNNPSRFKGEDLSVEQVTWDDCQEFLKKINEKTGKSFRLPTEAQWEFAARGGTLSKGFLYAGSNDLTEVGWFSDNAARETHPVGQKQANEHGIYDLSGNVWEWCQDCYDIYPPNPQIDPTGPKSDSTDAFHVLRGGSWLDGARDCRVSRRSYNAPVRRSYGIGFRLLLSAQ